MTTKLLLQSGLLNMTSANHHPEFPLSLGHCPKLHRNEVEFVVEFVACFGESATTIARFFGVSSDLVRFRAKVTRLYHHLIRRS